MGSIVMPVKPCALPFTTMPLRTRIKDMLLPKKRKGTLSQTTDVSESSTPPSQDGREVAGSSSDHNQDTQITPQTPTNKSDSIVNTHKAVDHESDQRQRAAIATLDIAIDISLLLREASEASSILVPLKVFSVTVEKVLRSIREKLAIDMALSSLSQLLDSHFRFIEAEMKEIDMQESKHSSEDFLESGFLAAFKGYLCALEDVRIEVMSRPLTGRSSPDVIPQLEKELDNGFKELMRQVHNWILRLATESSSHVTQMNLSRVFEDAIHAYGERIKPLTPGTRLALIQTLDSWARSPNCTEPIFWLHDEAGTGKSAIAAHMCRHWHKDRILAARFFFDRNGGRNLRRLDKFCVTLARDMVNNHPVAQESHLEMMESSLSVQQVSFLDSFQSLVVNVAQKISQGLPSNLIFVFDALDECHEDDVGLLISAIRQVLSSSQGIQFLLTSRPTKEITAMLDTVPGVGGNGVALLDVKHGVAQRDHDVSLYVRQTLKGFSIGDQNTVIECASGVFLWATLACETLLRTVAPSKLLIKFQNNTPGRTMESLYEAVLEAALPPLPSSRDFDLLQVVLQGVALTYSPVSIFSIRSFFPSHKDAKVQNEEFVQFFVERLGSIMKDGTPFLPIYLLHPTFREFVEDQRNGAKFYINPPAGHHSIASSSLALMNMALNPNALGLDDGRSPLPVSIQYKYGFEPPARLSLDTEAPFRYAIAFWAYHASLAIGEDEGLARSIIEFFRSKFIMWAEWSSAIKGISEGIDGIRRLQRAIRVQSTSETNRVLEEWCRECLRFLLLNGHIIEQSGLQAWMSALVFTPENSLIYKNFSQRSIRPLPRLLTHYSNESSNSGRVLWDNKERLDHVFFSPDGKRFLAFGRTTRLWNAKTLKVIKELKNGLIEEESDTVLMQTAIFSSDGCLIASDGDRRIHLWDGFTGAFREILPRRHESDILDVVFTLSNSVVVAVDQKHEILCWDVERTSQRPRRSRVVNGPAHTGAVTALVSSPNQRIFASFSSDKKIIIWNPETAEILGSPITTGEEIQTGLFSKDSSQIIAGHENGSITIWDVQSHNLVHSLRSGSGSVQALALSPDGRILASGSDRICLWEFKSGSILSPPIEGEALCLAFDGTGTRLVSASRQVYVHDIRFNANTVNIDHVTLQGHSGWIFGIAISPSGNLIVSASDDGTLRVWETDLLDGSDLEAPPPPTHSKITSLALSKDGIRLISIGEYQYFQIWDFMAGSKIGGLFRPPEGDVTKIIFSFSHSIWASAQSYRHNGNVFVWRHQADSMPPVPHVLPCAQGGIRCMAFDQSNTYLATGGEDHSIQIWELAGHSRVGSFDCLGTPLHIAISPDKQYLASDSLDGNIRLWNIRTLELTGLLNVFSTESQSRPQIHHVGFSPDGMTIIMKKDQSIHLLDVTRNLRCYATYDQPPFKSIHIPDDSSPIFSSDGRFLFYWNYTFDLTKISRDGSQPPVPMLSEIVSGSPFSLVSPLHLRRFSRYIHSFRWRVPLLVIPADVQMTRWVSHENMVGFGSEDGRVFIIRFPKEYI